MSEVPLHHVHFLVRRGSGNKIGWYAPYELEENDPSGAGLVIPVDAQGHPFSEYWLDAMISEGDHQEVLYFIFRPTESGEFVLETPAADIPFVERVARSDERALPYLGDLEHPDFAHLLVEIEPVRNDVYDIMLGDKSVTLIGCNPFEQYRKDGGQRL